MWKADAKYTCGTTIDQEDALTLPYIAAIVSKTTAEQISISSAAP